MVFEKETLQLPSSKRIRAKLRSLSLRHNLLSAGVILSLTGAGAFLPGILLDQGPKGYVSNATIAVSASNSSSSEVSRTIMQVREAVLSPISLGLAVSDLQLQAEDVGGSPQASRMGFLMDMLFEDGSNSGSPVNPAENALQKSINISASDNGIDVSAVAATPDIAQRIADYVSSRIITEVGIRGHEPGLQVLEQARKGLDNADAALTGFQMRHGEEAISRIRSLQQSRLDIDATIAALSRHSEELKDAVATVSAMKRDDILTKSLPALAAFAPAEGMRQTYDAAKLALAEVNVDHGPKHPRSIAAQGAVDAARTGMLTAARQGLEAVKREESTVTASLDKQSADRAELENQLAALGDAPAELARLETNLGNARRDYLAASEKVGPFARAPYVTATLLEKAEAGTARYDNASSGLMAAGGGLLGFLLSLLILSFRPSEQMEEEIVPDAANHIAVGEGEILLEPVVDEAPVFAEPIEIEPGLFDDLQNADIETVHVAEVPALHDEDRAVLDDDYQEAANDVPLDERVRQVLMGNLVRPEGASTAPAPFRLPPLLAAALAGDAEHAEAETDELKLLRQELALLKEQLREHSNAEDALRKSA